MVTPYAQGYSAENDLFNRMLKAGYEGKRAFKSQGSYDLMMFNETYRPLLIEVKYYKAMTSEPDTEVNNRTIKMILKKPNSSKLYARALSCNAYPLLAFKIKGKGFLFYRIDTNDRFFVPFKKLKEGLKKVLSRLPFS